MEIKIPVSQNTLSAVTKLDRFRGTWSTDPGIPTDRLENIAEATRIQSVAASSRLAGIRVTDADVAGLLRQGTVPLRDAREVVGYAQGLSWPIPESEGLLTSDDLCRLHAVVSGEGTDDPEPSRWRETTLYRETFDTEGQATGRVYTTLPPHMIQGVVDDLLTWLEFELRAGERHPVPVIGTFSLGLLTVSPFEKGNGRLARLLIPRLLKRAGYAYMPYASVESQIETLRDEYNEAYDRAQEHLWTDEADLEPWLEFFLKVLSRHRERVETKIELERDVLDYPPLQQAILSTVREHGSVDAGLLLRATGANRNTLKDNLRRLVDRGALEKTGQRRGTRYRLAVAE